MAYATQQDIIDRYGNDALFVVADRDNDNVIDAVVVDGALSDATDEINAYVASKYALPLATVPPVLKRMCVDIALYRLSPDGSYTEEKRQRYEDAVKLLTKFSNGDASLGLPENSTPDSAVGDVELISSDRQFSRRTMGRLL